MTVHLHTRARCDECDRIASVEVEPDCFLCDDCVAIVCAVLSSSCGSDGPGRASVAGDAGIAGPQDSNPSSCGGVDRTRFSDGGGTSRLQAPRVGIKPDPQDSTFEAEVSALEAEWAARGIIMNASTLRTVAPSRMASNDISKSVSVGE